MGFKSMNTYTLNIVNLNSVFVKSSIFIYNLNRAH